MKFDESGNRIYLMSSESRKYHRDNARKNYAKNTEHITRKKWKENNPKPLRWSYYRGNARKKGITFSLTREQFYGLIQRDCVYCGQSPSPLNGVDRKDNSIGYTVENSLSCCEVCNHMKHTMSVEDFINRCTKIVKHMSDL